MREHSSSVLKTNNHARHPNAFKFYSVHVFILYIVYFTDPSAGEKITCTIPSAKLNTSTYLKCFFPEDLSQCKKDFTVYHYVNHGSPDAVLDCWWLGGKLDCFTRPGYDFEFVVTDCLTVHLPRVEESQAGTYACQVAGYKPEHLSTCDLNVKSAGIASAPLQLMEAPVVNARQKGRDFSPRITTTCLSTVDVLGHPASITCNFGYEKPTESFIVSHTYLNNGFEAEEFPMLCTWVEGAHVCDVLPGYVLESRITKEAKLNIHTVTEAHLGAYWCRKLGASKDGEESCEIRPQSNLYQTSPSNSVVVVLPIIIIVVFAALVIFAIIKRQRLKTVWRTAKKRFRGTINSEDTDPESVSQCKQDSSPSPSQSSVIDKNEVDEQTKCNKTTPLLEDKEQSSVEGGSPGSDSGWGSDENKKASPRKRICIGIS